MLHSGSDDTLDVVGGGGRRGELSTVGLMLRETRERYGLTLRDVANALRIRVVYLHALEEGRFADLPGRPYVTGFLRSYAEYFGMDSDEVVHRYREERSDGGRPAKLVFPEPPPETKFPVGAMLAILVVVSIVGYGGWQLIGGGTPESRPLVVAEVPTDLALQSDLAESEIDEAQAGAVDGALLAEADVVPQAPATTRSMAPAAATDAQAALDPESVGKGTDAALPPIPPGVDTGSEPVEDWQAEDDGAMIEFSSASAASMPAEGPFSAGNPHDGAAALPAGGAAATPISPSLLGFPNAGESTVPSDLAALGPLQAGAPSADATAAESAATAVYGDVNTDARVILRATADCWIEIKDGDGSEVFTRLLRQGEIYKVPNRGDLLLRMGNAGGLEVLVDGTALPPLGGDGEVMRNVSLDPATLAASL
jgi:cytoskeleton protein RodZ